MILARRLVTVPLVMLSGCTSDAPPPEARDATLGGDAAAGVSIDAGYAGSAGDGSGGSPGSSQPIDSGRLAAPGVLLDPDIPPAIAGEDGWGYEQSASADFDGDSTLERVVLTARVEMYRGRPAWDDGQPWQVYVEAAGGARTYLYAQRLQLGTLTMRITAGAAGRPPTIVLLEHLPHRLSVYEAAYAGPDSATVVTRFQREVDPRGETASPRFQ